MEVLLGRMKPSRDSCSPPICTLCIVLLLCYASIYQPPPLFHLPHLSHHGHPDIRASLLHHVPHFVLHQAAALTPLGQTWSLPVTTAGGGGSAGGSGGEPAVDPVTAAAASAYGGSLAQSKVCLSSDSRSTNIFPLDTLTNECLLDWPA